MIAILSLNKNPSSSSTGISFCGFNWKIQAKINISVVFRFFYFSFSFCSERGFIVSLNPITLKYSSVKCSPVLKFTGINSNGIFNAFKTIRVANDGGPSDTAYNFILESKQKKIQKND